MDMHTRENSVSFQYNFHMETKLVLFIILCTIIHNIMFHSEQY